MAAEQGLLLEVDSGAQVGPLDRFLTRTHLGNGAWIDVRRSWLQGAGSVFGVLTDDVDWQQERRLMYDRVVDVPRLVRFYERINEVPHWLMVEAAAALTHHYLDELPEGFSSVGLCLYRGGNDSVAWHGDTTGRGAVEDTLVAIVSLGAPRALALRPRGGGAAMKITLDSGDLLVMGGSCQRTWQHSVPKTARAVGARISVQFRAAGVR